MSLLSALLHLTNFRTPFLRTLIPSIGLAFTLQAAAAVPSIAFQTERYYDLSGSLTYISCTALSLYLPALRARAAAHLAGAPLPAFPSLVAALTSRGPSAASGLGWNWRQVVLSAFVAAWAARLGSFLFARIAADDGRDSRFDAIRGSPPKFLGAFVAQATWVSLCLLPVLSVNAMPAAALARLPLVGLADVAGVALFVGGIAFEATADRQKNVWVKEKKEKKHEEDFLTRGLWSKSRHPNYFGEATLWTGIATVAAGAMMSAPGQAAIGLGGGATGRIAALAMAGVSPAFVTFLLFFVSGIPLSEKKYDKKYGDRKDYQEWKKNTPVFIPKL